ncbi:MAG: serine hydrolase domain-containing protein, partial [Pseudomonadota bacterium]
MPRILMILPSIFFLLALLTPLVGSASPGDATFCGLFRQLSEEYKLNTAGAALIRDGRVQWTCFAGEEATGVQASARTRFNVASITKVIVTEAILVEVGAGRLDLNESMAPWWTDPDLANDPRHERLTPRMVLTHQTGLPNWRYFAADRKLHFTHDP